MRNGILTPLSAIVHAMREVADQKFETAVPGLGRTNEIGLLAGALEVFKTNGLERRRLSEQQLHEAQHQAERSKFLDDRIKRFNDLVASVVASVASSAQVPAVSSGSVIRAWRNFAWVAGSLPA